MLHQLIYIKTSIAQSEEIVIVDFAQMKLLSRVICSGAMFNYYHQDKYITMGISTKYLQLVPHAIHAMYLNQLIYFMYDSYSASSLHSAVNNFKLAVLESLTSSFKLQYWIVDNNLAYVVLFQCSSNKVVRVPAYIVHSNVQSDSILRTHCLLSIPNDPRQLLVHFENIECCVHSIVNMQELPLTSFNVNAVMRCITVLFD